MLQELNEKRITLMEGTALSERDLQRSRAESASAVFLLADRFSPNYQQEDLNVQFQVQRIFCILFGFLQCIKRDVCLYSRAQSVKCNCVMLLNGIHAPCKNMFELHAVQHWRVIPTGAGAMLDAKIL